VGCSGLWPPRKWAADSVRTMRIESVSLYLARAWMMTGTAGACQSCESAMFEAAVELALDGGYRPGCAASECKRLSHVSCISHMYHRAE
jgi:hypothetical protein